MRALGQQLASKVTRGMNQANNKIATNLSQAKAKIDRVGNNFAKNTIEAAIAGKGGPSIGARIKGMADGQAQQVVGNAQQKWAEGFANGMKPQPRARRNSTKAASPSAQVPQKTEASVPAAISDGGNGKGPNWRGMTDIKMTAQGDAPLSTFFRNREARDAMIASGEGSAHKWAKGSTSWKRVGATVGAGYVGIDTVDRMSSGGSLTRNETGKTDLMGIPIL